ncbi:sterol desaturase family protein [Sulfitobacter sp. D35]|uniref:sterol desaturase family protein n=1 Tax=Sulfitobacter sp. D35 TaxID=3083252 RepID=UPI00296FE83E|nr:sterol desaturase family protein [Sulfitobacter sp. D35]
MTGALFDLNVRYSLFYLSCTILIAFLVWRYRGRPESFSTWLFPKAVYTHRSNLLDIKLFITGRLFSILGLFGAVFFPTTIAYAVLTYLSPDEFSAPPISWSRGFIATVVVVVTSDFCKYWAHRAHHEWRFLWPFHAVHHSADVLTPLTVERVHPLEPIIRNLLMTLVVGLVQGLVLYGLVGQINLTTIGGANALYFVFNALGSNFRHSHIWISYGPVLEHVFISPAQHQIHHSVARKHHDKNYGSIFAVWDWAFGTLYVPTEQEKLRFGVSDGTDKPVEQPYPTLVAALILPFTQSWSAIVDKMGGTQAQRTQTPAPQPAATPALAPAMPQGFSLWLDVLRAGAALTVLFGHMAHVRFTGGKYYFLRDWNVASDAVAVFFVLSGVVIAYAAGRDATLSRFAFNRVTRVASVLVPALLLTLVFDAIGTRTDMSAYPQGYYQQLSLGEFLWRGLTVTNLWTGAQDWVRLGSNGPVWSLSYEIGFYLIFGAMIFLKGLTRAAVLAMLVLLVGIPILVMFPAWYLGVLVWKRVSAAPSTRSRKANWAIAVGSIALLVALKVAKLPNILENLTIAVLQPVNHHDLLVYSNEVLWNTVIALLLAVHLIAIWALAQDGARRAEGRFARLVRWIAGGSFSLYLVHYPTLHLLDATLPATLPGHDLWMLVLTLAVCFGFAAIFERPIRRYRAVLRALFARIASPREADTASAG